MDLVERFQKWMLGWPVFSAVEPTVKDRQAYATDVVTSPAFQGGLLTRARRQTLLSMASHPEVLALRFPAPFAVSAEPVSFLTLLAVTLGLDGAPKDAFGRSSGHSSAQWGPVWDEYKTLLRHAPPDLAREAMAMVAPALWPRWEMEGIRLAWPTCPTALARLVSHTQHREVDFHLKRLIEGQPLPLNTPVFPDIPAGGEHRTSDKTPLPWFIRVLASPDDHLVEALMAHISPAARVSVSSRAPDWPDVPNPATTAPALTEKEGIVTRNLTLLQALLDYELAPPNGFPRMGPDQLARRLRLFLGAGQDLRAVTPDEPHAPVLMMNRLVEVVSDRYGGVLAANYRDVQSALEQALFEKTLDGAVALPPPPARRRL
jgi:hypothetical protein